ncbi:MAG: translesion DNA synthesis-associated protein ImuA [Pseudoxanthomonas suwonensis]|nr:translesion DNA synthesis-associated protein ImuA [Pseudoxanthomonas suwonensis]
MGAVVALTELIDDRRVWRGPAPLRHAPARAPTGHPALDAALPGGGWVADALNEILFPFDGVGELGLLWPTLRRLSAGSEPIVLVAPPYELHAPGWHHAGIALERLQLVRAEPREALWAAEQCLRSGACSAVLCWPRTRDGALLRRLNVAAETGKTLGFAFRDAREARNPSPAPLRLRVHPDRQVQVMKCRGGSVPARLLPIAAAERHRPPAH